MIKFCNLYSGSSGNCLFICYRDTRILIDAGLSGIAIERALGQIDESPKDIDAILISHDHSDHTSGVGVLSRRYDIPLYANSGTWSIIERSVGKLREQNKKCFDTKKQFQIKQLGIDTFSTPHDACEPVAFCFMTGKKRVTTATDMGHMNENILKELENSDLLFIESNHDIEMLKAGPYPYFLKKRILGEYGHLSNDAAAETIAYLAKKGMQKFILGHLSKDNNHPLVAMETVKAELIQNGFDIEKDICLSIARRDLVGDVMFI